MPYVAEWAQKGAGLPLPPVRESTFRSKKTLNPSQESGLGRRPIARCLLRLPTCDLTATSCGPRRVDRATTQPQRNSTTMNNMTFRSLIASRAWTGLLPAILLLATLQACTSEVADDLDLLTEQEAEMAAEVVAATLSDQESGVLSTMYDALSTVDSRGLQYGVRPPMGNGMAKSGPDGSMSGRGHEKKFEHSYDSTTGVHTVVFERSMSVGPFSKSISKVSTYQYRDTADVFIARPRKERDRIESIAYTASVEGNVIRRDTSATFSRTDTMQIRGIHATSAELLMDGNHAATGRRPMRPGKGQGADRPGFGARPDTTARPYAVEFTFTGIRVDKESVQQGDSLENAISGRIDYTLYYQEDGEERVVEGTIDLEGNGAAVVRFRAITHWVRFALSDGRRLEGPKG